MHSSIVKLNKIFPDYDTEIWSRYKDQSYVYLGWGSERYDFEHIKQIKILASLTFNNTYAEIILKWFDYVGKKK